MALKLLAVVQKHGLSVLVQILPSFSVAFSGRNERQLMAIKPDSPPPFVLADAALILLFNVGYVR